MKILTAIGNPILNNKLKELENVYVIGKDIQYQEGVIEILEENFNIDCLIINNKLPGEMGFYKLINKIKNIKKDIDIYVFLDEKDEDAENYLMSYQIYKIYYLNEINFDEFIKNFQNIEENLLDGINKEINEFKKLILNENVNEDNYSFAQNKINESFGIYKNDNYIEEEQIGFNEEKDEEFFEEDNIKNDELCKTIAISGDFGSGKSIISSILSKIISKQNKKTLLIDFDIYNSTINTIFGTRKYNGEQNYIEENIKKIDENLDILCGIDKIIDFKENLNSYLIKEILERLKKDYEFILIDVSSRIDFKYVKIILTYCDKILFLIEPNLLEISKSNKMLEVLINDFDINVDKIKILFNKSNQYQIAESVLEEIFSEFEIIENLKYEENYNLFINKNTNCEIEEKKFKKIYEKLSMKGENVYANTSVGSY